MQSYTTIIGVIELRLQKQSYDIVQKRFGIGSSTVTLIMKRFKEMGLSIDDLKQMEPRKLETAFYPPENRRDTSIPLPDFNTVHAQMISMGRNADLAYIWKEGAGKPEFMKAAFKLGDGEFKKNDNSFSGGTVDMSVVKVENLREFSDLNPLPLPNKASAKTLPEIKRFIMPSAEAYAEAAYLLQKKTREFKLCFSDDTIKAVNLATLGSMTDADNKWIDDIFKEVMFKDNNSLQQKSLSAWEDRFGGATEDPKAPFLSDGFANDKDDTFGNPQYLSRKMIAHLLLKLYKHEKNVIVPQVPATAPVYGKLFLRLCIPYPRRRSACTGV